MNAISWEYATVALTIHNPQAVLNAWGEELVQVVQGPESGLVSYLKRPLA
jgi:hypothetical protein